MDEPLSESLPNRLLTNGTILGPQYGKTSTFVVGLDLTGSGQNWHDSSSIEPVRIGERYFAHKQYGNVITDITKGSHADSLGLKPGDIVLSLGGYNVTNTRNVSEIKSMFPLRARLELIVLRQDDPLHFDVFNGQIGDASENRYNVVELDPQTGRHLSEKDLPPGYDILACKADGELIYQFQDTLFFLEPITDKNRTCMIAGLKDYRKLWVSSYKADILLPFKTSKETGYAFNKILALDISRTANDSTRVLWEQRLEGNICETDEEKTLPTFKEDGTLLIMDRASGAILAQEILPFKSITSPQVKNGTLYGIVSGRLFAWRLAYYHPPFPWRFVWYSGVGVALLTIACLGIHLLRVRNLKKKQEAELERERLKQELAMAAEIHQKIVPKPHELPLIKGITVYGHNFLCREIGGDYFDVIPISEDHVGCIICDVSGKGLAAALLVSTLQATFHSLFLINMPLPEIAQRTNSILYHNTTPDKFATGFIGIIDLKQRRMETINAGHNVPYLLRASGETVRLDQGGLGFGMFDFAQYKSQTTALAEGDLLYLFTDGISEAANSQEEEFGESRRGSLMAHQSWKTPRELIEQIEQSVRTWTGRRNAGEGFLHDDFTQLAIQVVQ